MSDEVVTVRITLRKSVAERLRAMCHARGETASVVVDRWVFEHDERGDLKPAPAPNRGDENLKRIIRDAFTVIRG